MRAAIELKQVKSESTAQRPRSEVHPPFSRKAIVLNRTCDLSNVQLWSSDWDALFALDKHHAFLRNFAATVDGKYQTLGAKDGRYNLENFFGLDRTATISNPSGTDQVTLTNFTGRLTAADFSFA